MAAPLSAPAADRRTASRWILPVAPTLLVAAATLAAVWCAAQPHGVASRLLLGASATTATAGLGWAWWRTRDRPAGTWGVLAVALLLRAAAFPLGPTLSDDAYRYVWDGVVAAEGLNPYAFPPSADALRPMRERLPYDALNSADFYSVYPPASQLVFQSAAVLAGPGAEWVRIWMLIKAILVGLEAVALLLLARLVTGRALALYAWHPLAVLEVAGQGHTEAAMLPALVAAALLLTPARLSRRAQAGVGAALAWATLVKLVPLVLAPFALRKGGRWAVLAGTGVGAVLAWPYAEPYVIPNVRTSLDLYVRYFEFNAGPYFALKQLGRWWTGEDVSKTLGPALRAAFALGLLPLWWAAWRRRWDFAAAALVGWAWFFCTTTTVHPWYLLGALVLVPVVAEREAGRRVAAAWAVLATGAVWTYTYYAGLERVYWIAVIAMWSLWLCLLTLTYARAGLTALMESRARSKWRWIASYLRETDPPRDVLDLGAGEGFVGQAVQQVTGARVVLCDVADFNRTALPHRLYDGRSLPYADASFDLVLLAYVLHHAGDPERVLSETYRVLKPGGRVAVLESVAETARDRRLLHVLDPLANRIRSGGLMAAQEEHLAFRSAHAWRQAFRAAGFDVAADERRGRLVHKRHLFLLVKRRGEDGE